MKGLGPHGRGKGIVWILEISWQVLTFGKDNIPLGMGAEREQVTMELL